jgi:hypothetical protein
MRRGRGLVRPGRLEDAPHGCDAEDQVLSFRQQLGEVLGVRARVPRPVEVHDRLGNPRVSPPRQCPTTVAVDEPAWASGEEGGFSRRAWRCETVISAAASSSVMAPSQTRVRIQARCCSLALIVMSSSLMGGQNHGSLRGGQIH